MKRKQKSIFTVIITVILVVLLKNGNIDDLLPAIRQNDSYNAPTSAELTVNYIDVGQGDCSLIHLPNGTKMMIDAGTSESYENIEKVLTSTNTQKIDYLIATHPHADHIGSMRRVIENYPIGSIYMPKATSNSATFEKLLLTIKEKGYNINSTVAGMTIYQDENTKIETLAPNNSSYENLNNYSIVVKLSYKNQSLLFMGDAEILSENEILNNGYIPKADVIKLGHHGSSTSNSKKFLEAVNPRYAIISCGADNEYAHPHDEIVRRIENAGITYYRTDTNGTVTLTSDGDGIAFSTER